MDPFVLLCLFILAVWLEPLPPRVRFLGDRRRAAIGPRSQLEFGDPAELLPPPIDAAGGAR